MKYIASGTVIDWGSNKVLNTVRVAGNCSGSRGRMPEVDANLWPVEVANPLFRFEPDMSKKGRTSPFFGDNGTPSVVAGAYATSGGSTTPTQQLAADARFVRMPDPVPIPQRNSGAAPAKARPEYGSTSIYSDGGPHFTTTPGNPDPSQVFADDWNGDGKEEPIVRHGNTFYAAGTRSPKPILAFGRPGDQVFAGNWGRSAEGEVNFAVRRGNIFCLNDSMRGGIADRSISYGRIGDEVLIGDWDGDGIDTPAVRRGNTIYIKNDWTGGVADQVFSYGRATDELIAGDFDGDGADSLSVKRGNLFYINNRFAGGEAQYTVYYGRSDTFVIVGDFNGDGVDTLGGGITW